MLDKTVIYYTSNREDPVFERKIRENIHKQKGKLPIISISQKPIDFGKNICVGDVGHSYLNEYRQILIGVKEAKTDYIIFTEADFLYPKDYFSFKPDGANMYRYDNIWIVFREKIYSYRRKPYSVGAQIANRKYVINLLEDHLKGQPEWFDGEFAIRNERGRRKKDVFLSIPFKFFGTDNPCISFKTGDGMRRQTPVMHGRENILTKLPFWGNVYELRKKYLGQQFT